MSFVEILDSLFLKPLQLIFEIIYIITNRVIENPGLSIVVLSLVMNFLVLPLYKRADAMQEEERDMERKLHRGVSHIKKTFAGDERMMMLQTYYRQNHYKPTYVLRGAVSLFLEIPFFIAAYRFLSGLQLLNGVSFGPIVDLGKPDEMLVIAGVTIHILPIIMTVVNLVSCIIYTKGSPLKTKVQLYAMALFFLFFLYSSPAGLVFYWTLNNIFSLIKTIFYKLKNPLKVFGIISSVSGIGLLVYGIFLYKMPTFKRLMLFVGCGLFMQIPFIYSFFKNKIYVKKDTFKKANVKIFLIGTLFLAVLTGIVIPSTVISASPQEFIDIHYFYHPIWYIIHSFCHSFGIFVIWMGIFYWLARPSVRFYFDKAIWIFAGCAIINYMFFGKKLGILTSSLKYENDLNFTSAVQLWNIVILIVVSVVLYLFYEYFEKFTFEILLAGVIALGIMSVINVFNIHNSVENLKASMNDNDEMPYFTLSKKGENVIVFMLDRAMGEYIPFLFHEKPELKEKFSGFTYYSNTISFGGHTNFGAPALFGGYEYTPVEINKRTEESLVSKHNEALKVMPVLFDQNNFDVTVCDPVYANYQWTPDLSIYDEYPDIKKYNTRGKFTDSLTKEIWVQNNMRNFFCFGLLKSIPLCLQRTIYDYGMYNQEENATIYSKQKLTSKFSSIGFHGGFIESYNVLLNLEHMTNILESDQDTFLLMTNDATHESMLLQEPDYIPARYVDNTEYENNNMGRFTLNGITLKMEQESQITSYHANMAAMLQLGKWFDYMRENDVYDNTRIILVSDHGCGLQHLDEFIFDDVDEAVIEDGKDASFYFPLLMVKDFNNEEFNVSEEFMTNGDVPTIAVKGIINHPVNPFTGKLIDASEKLAHDQYIIAPYPYDWDVDSNKGNIFNPAMKWYSIHDNIWDKNNWKVVAENAVMPVQD